MFKLMISDDEGKTTSVPLVRDEITIGRKEGNTIRLTDRNVSRRHARLQKQNGHYLLHDLGSYNGIVINGARLNDTCSLKNGDQILIGDYKLAIQEEASAQAHTPAATASSSGSAETLDAAPVVVPQPPVTHPTAPGIPSALAMQAAPQPASPVPAPAPAMGRISAPPTPPAQSASVPLGDNSSESYKQMRLVFLAPAGVPAPVMLDRLPMILGRSEAADIALPFSSISREHARIALHNGELVVEDLGSANGIMVNGVKTPRSPITAGDLVTLGVVEFRVARRGDNTMVIMREGITEPRKSAVPGILAGVLGGGGVIGLLVFFVMRSSVPTPPAAPAETNMTAPSSAANSQPDPPLALAPTPQPAAMAAPPTPAPAPITEAVPMQPPPPQPPIYVAQATAEPAPAPRAERSARATAPDRHVSSNGGSSAPANSPVAAASPPPRQNPQPAASPAPSAAPASSGSRSSSGSSASSASAAAAPSAAQSPIDEARACLRQSDNACAVNALRGRAATEPELALLATTYRQMGNRPQAEGVMRRYLTRFPAGPRSQSFRDFLDSE